MELRVFFIFLFFVVIFAQYLNDKNTLSSMKRIFLTVGAILAGICLVEAQNCTYYFPVKVGASLVTKHYNDKDKLTSTTKSKVTEQTGNKVKFKAESYDSKDKLLSSGDYEVRCENNEFVMDMNSYFNTDAYKNMEVKVDSKAMSIPSSLNAGQKLNDGEINVTISNPGMNMIISTKITNRKVEALEEITTPAGKYKCAKITYDIETKMGMVIKTKGVEWISQKVGIVRSESYDQKGKLMSYSVLSSFSE